LSRDGSVIIDQDLSPFVDQLIEQAEDFNGYELELPADQMQYEIETADVRLMFVFSSLVLLRNDSDSGNIYLDPYNIYFGDN
jgi:hypothetical protein